MPEFYMILAPKIIKKYPNFYYLPEKFTKFPNFTRFLPQNARILHNKCPKNIFPNFRGGARARSRPPVSYAYAAADVTTTTTTTIVFA